MAQSPFRVLLAGRVVEIRPLFAYLRRYCQSYLTDAPADFSIAITPADIAFEREKSAREDEIEGLPVRRFSDEYLETLAAYRKIAGKLLDYETLLFHGSALALDGVSCLFTAASGTGKSTHARLWREQFGARVVMVNDDKPLLKVTDHGVIAYGTPWDGKHRLSTNTSVPLKAVCFLTRGETNQIEPTDIWTVYPKLLQQTYRPDDEAAMEKTLSLIEKMGESTELYSLACNMEAEAARVAWMGMKEGKSHENRKRI